MQKYTSKVKFPKGADYIIGCTDEGFAPSKSSNNPMITLEFEVRAPESKMIDGEEYNMAGTRVAPVYFVTVPMDAAGVVDKDKQKATVARLEKVCRAFGLPFDSATFNPENPTLGFKGKNVYAALYCESSEQRDDPTPEQLARKELGTIQKNPITGEPRVRHNAKIDEIFGLAQTDATKPY